MTTTVNYVGTTWAGQGLDRIEDLMAALARETLDPTFEEFGNFVLESEPPAIPAGYVRFWGNFYTLSYVFSVDTDDLALIKRLTDAIRANQATPAYAQAKAERAAAEQRRREHHQQQERERNAKRVAELKRELASLEG